jgi:hypothetical protein
MRIAAEGAGRRGSGELGASTPGGTYQNRDEERDSTHRYRFFTVKILTPSYRFDDSQSFILCPGFCDFRASS